MAPPRPKVLIVHSTLHIGGAEEVTATLCRHIDKRRFDVAVCYLKEQGLVGEKIAAEGTEVFGIPRSRRFKTDYFTALSLRRTLRRRGIRLMHSHDTHALADMTLCRLTTPGVRSVHTFHYGRYPERDRSSRTIESLCWRWVDQPVAVSSVQRANIGRLYGIPDGRVAVVWNGVDRQPPGPPPDVIREQRARGRTVIGCINTLIEQKGMFDLLEVAARLKSQGLRDYVFLVAGDGHLRIPLEERRHALGLDDEVVFLGWVKDAARVLMEHVDIFFQPSLWEAMSMVLLEAMAAGRAIVATRVGETPLVVEHGASALLVDAADIDGMAASLQRLLLAPDLRQTLGRTAAARYAQEFTARAMAERYMNLYDATLAGRSLPGRTGGRVVE